MYCMQQGNSLQLVLGVVQQIYCIHLTELHGQKQRVIHLVLGMVVMYAMQQGNSLQLVADPETYGIHLTGLHGQKRPVIHLVLGMVP